LDKDKLMLDASHVLTRTPNVLHLDELSDKKLDGDVVRAYLDEEGIYNLNIEECPILSKQIRSNVVQLFPVSRVRKVEITSAKDVLKKAGQLIEEIDALLEKQKKIK
jgi:hypothetical protein